MLGRAKLNYIKSYMKSDLFHLYSGRLLLSSVISLILNYQLDKMGNCSQGFHTNIRCTVLISEPKLRVKQSATLVHVSVVFQYFRVYISVANTLVHTV